MGKEIRNQDASELMTIRLDFDAKSRFGILREPESGRIRKGRKRRPGTRTSTLLLRHAAYVNPALPGSGDWPWLAIARTGIHYWGIEARTEYIKIPPRHAVLATHSSGISHPYSASHGDLTILAYGYRAKYEPAFFKEANYTRTTNDLYAIRPIAGHPSATLITINAHPRGNCIRRREETGFLHRRTDQATVHTLLSGLEARVLTRIGEKAPADPASGSDAVMIVGLNLETHSFDGAKKSEGFRQGRRVPPIISVANLLDPENEKLVSVQKDLILICNAPALQQRIRYKLRNPRSKPHIRKRVLIFFSGGSPLVCHGLGNSDRRQGNTLNTLEASLWWWWRCKFKLPGKEGLVYVGPAEWEGNLDHGTLFVRYREKKERNDARSSIQGFFPGCARTPNQVFLELKITSSTPFVRTWVVQHLQMWNGGHKNMSMRRHMCARRNRISEASRINHYTLALQQKTPTQSNDTTPPTCILPGEHSTSFVNIRHRADEPIIKILSTYNPYDPSPQCLHLRSSGNPARRVRYSRSSPWLGRGGRKGNARFSAAIVTPSPALLYSVGYELAKDRAIVFLDNDECTSRVRVHDRNDYILTSNERMVACMGEYELPLMSAVAWGKLCTHIFCNWMVVLYAFLFCEWFHSLQPFSFLVFISPNSVQGSLIVRLEIGNDSRSTLFFMERPAPILRDWWHGQYLSELGTFSVRGRRTELGKTVGSEKREGGSNPLLQSEGRINQYAPALQGRISYYRKYWRNTNLKMHSAYENIRESLREEALYLMRAIMYREKPIRTLKMCRLS
ncbi:hypothetical protein EDD85DRAFT_798406 [Armillaria nabsnona]|nr:hypothetical protein EDD85DRAFT_798406 [Armillaria nabsnona]